MKRFVYADNAATTSVSPKVLEAMLPFFGENYGNAMSLYSKGREAKKPLEEARETIAGILECKPSEIYFTSCGCESDNWAIKGTALANAKKGKHIITSKIEHPAVLETCRALEKQGYEVTYLDVDENGFVNPDDVKNAIRDDTILVAVMYANNEIGTIQPIKEIARIAHERNVYCFTDAVQAVGNIPVSVKDLDVDMLSFSGHKIHAPKGIGVLYIKSGTRVFDLIDGGGQERGRRAGTENTAYIVGIATALKEAVEALPDMKRVEKMRDRLADELLKVPYSRLNGSRENRLPGNINISFEYIEGESMLLLCDMDGICISTGSACSSNSLEPSHVLLAIGLPHEKAHGSARITISHQTTDEDIDYIIEKLPPIVKRLRDMSPIYPANRT
ncbi:MAG: cysteine desulfurase NifS [Clostridia bacterium]|nr:cysteine desulfurase NifS [Clostridia bacterium]